MGLNRSSRRHAAIGIVLAVLVVAGCGNGGDETAPVAQEAQETAQDVRQAASEAWASLKNERERLVNEIQSNKDPGAKQELLQRCRDSVDKLRQAESDQADRVQSLCDRIQNTDINAGEAWTEIKKEIAELNPA